MDEKKFQEWYRKWATKWKLDPNPDDPRHFYDYRAAFEAGAEPNEEGHWPSEFKREGHPNQFVGGMDTKTGKPIIAPGLGAEKATHIGPAEPSKWERFNTPLVEQPPIADTTQARMMKAFMDNLTSPANLSLSALSGGANMAGKAGLFGVSSAARAAEGALQIPYLVEGIRNMLSGKTGGEKLLGGAQALLSGLGIRGAGKRLGPIAKSIPREGTIPIEDLMAQFKSEGVPEAHAGQIARDKGMKELGDAISQLPPSGTITPESVQGFERATRTPLSRAEFATEVKKGNWARLFGEEKGELNIPPEEGLVPTRVPGEAEKFRVADQMKDRPKMVNRGTTKISIEAHDNYYKQQLNQFKEKLKKTHVDVGADIKPKGPRAQAKATNQTRVLIDQMKEWSKGEEKWYAQYGLNAPSKKGLIPDVVLSELEPPAPIFSLQNDDPNTLIEEAKRFVSERRAMPESMRKIAPAAVQPTGLRDRVDEIRAMAFDPEYKNLSPVEIIRNIRNRMLKKGWINERYQVHEVGAILRGQSFPEAKMNLRPDIVKEMPFEGPQGARSLGRRTNIERVNIPKIRAMAFDFEGTPQKIIDKVFERAQAEGLIPANVRRAELVNILRGSSFVRPDMKLRKEIIDYRPR